MCWQTFPVCSFASPPSFVNSPLVNPPGPTKGQFTYPHSSEKKTNEEAWRLGRRGLGRLEGAKITPNLIFGNVYVTDHHDKANSDKTLLKELFRDILGHLEGLGQRFGPRPLSLGSKHLLPSQPGRYKPCWGLVSWGRGALDCRMQMIFFCFYGMFVLQLAWYLPFEINAKPLFH